VLAFALPVASWAQSETAGTTSAGAAQPQEQAAAGGAPGNMDEYMKRMQDHMLEMHELMHQILLEQDPKKKDELKAKQREAMRQHWQEMAQMRRPMRGMYGPGMYGPPGPGMYGPMGPGVAPPGPGQSGPGAMPPAPPAAAP
jgi:hypothetical protein